MTKRPIPEATVGRLPVYLRVLVEMAEDGRSTVSSEGLAEAAGVNSAKVRKDLSYLGSYGTRGVGYDVAYLIHQVRRELGLTQDWPVLIAGVGNLGHALANYRGFDARGFRVAGLVDPERVGEVVAGVEVRPPEDMPDLVRAHDIQIGLICTPGSAAQGAADLMVESGIRSILNFSPVVITCPEGVSLRKVDLSVELQILAFYEQRKAVLDEVRRGEALPETLEETAERPTA